MVGRGSLVALGAVLVGSMLTPAAATATSAPLIAGRLTGVGGRPVAGVVTLQAWPDPLPDKVGQTFQMIDIARQKVGSDGKYRFDASQVVLTPQLRRAAAFNNGRVNFEVLGDTPGRIGQVDTSRSVTSRGWEVTRSDVPVSADTAAPMRNYRAAVATATPADPTPQCTSKVVGRRRHSAKVGEVHRWVGSTADFYYGSTADSDVGVAYSKDGAGWSLSGHVHIGNSAGAEIHIPFGRGQGTAKYMMTDFIYDKIHVTWNGVGPCHPGYRTRAASWAGGADYGKLGNHWDGRCNLRPSVDRTRWHKGTDLDRNSSRATHYGASVSVYGATLDATSGYSTDVRFHYHFQSGEWVCGKGKPPTRSQWVAVGPRW